MTGEWTYWPSDPYWSQAGFWDYRPPWIRPARPTTVRWALQQQQPLPIVEPTDLALVKQHLRVTFTDEDAYIANLIQVARNYVEITRGLCTITQQWKLYLDRFPFGDRVEQWPWTAPLSAIMLPRFPIQSVDSIQYTDSAGAAHTVAPSDYVVDNVSRIARVVPAANKSWPGTSFAPQNAVVVSFTAGYGNDGSSLPPTLRQALLLLVGLWYENREDIVVGTRLAAVTIPKAADALLQLHDPVLVG